MPQLQTDYQEDHAAAVAGLMANPQTCDVDSRRVEGAAGIDFGYAVQVGTASDQVKRGVAANKFAGIAVLDSTLQPVQNDKYVQGDVASILWRGEVWVPVETPVVAGDNVVADTTTGQLSSAETGGVDSITVTDGGSGYTAATTVAITGGSGTGATAEAVIEGGVITEIRVTATGSGYTSDPTVTIADTGGGTGATATAARQTGVAIAGARFMSAAAAGELARVRLMGPLPSS